MLFSTLRFIMYWFKDKVLAGIKAIMFEEVKEEGGPTQYVEKKKQLAILAEKRKRMADEESISLEGPARLRKKPCSRISKEKERSDRKRISNRKSSAASKAGKFVQEEMMKDMYVAYEVRMASTRIELNNLRNENRKRELAIAALQKQLQE